MMNKNYSHVNGCVLDLPFHAKQYLFAVVISTVLLDLFFLFSPFSGKDVTLTLDYVIYLLLCSSVIFFPKTGIFLVIIYDIAAAALPFMDSANMFFGVCLSFLILAYSFPITASLSIFVSYSFFEFIVSQWHSVDVSIVIAICTIRFISALIGIVFRLNRLQSIRNEEINRLHEEEKRLEIVNNNLLLASRLHDHLTNDLAAIIILCDSIMLSDSFDSNIKRIKGRAENGISCAREVIDILSSDFNFRKNNNNWIDDLKQFVSSNIRDLDKCGIHGRYEISLKDPPTYLSSDLLYEIKSLIVEVCSNIAKYSVAADGPVYSLDICIGASEFRICQMNVGVDAKGSSSRRGLSLHRRIIRSFGGTLRSSFEDNVWCLRVVIPYS